MEILNPTIEWMGFELREPVTSATDFLTALVGLFAYFSLRQLTSKNQFYSKMKYYFLVMFIAMTFAALTGHLLQAYVSWEYKIIGWSFASIALFIFEIASISILPISHHRWISVASLFSIIHLALFFIAMIIPSTRLFDIVKINSAFGLFAIILPIHIWNFKQKEALGSKWIIIGIFGMLLPGIVFNFELSFSKWFNYHDISHCLMAINILFLYLGAKAFAEKKQFFYTK